MNTVQPSASLGSAVSSRARSLGQSARFYTAKALYGLSIWIEPSSAQQVLGDLRPAAQEIWNRGKRGERSGKITLDWHWPAHLEPRANAAEETRAAVPVANLGDLAAAVGEFQRRLPDWWFSVCACSVSRDASCGPDRAGKDAWLLEDRLFDDGFHCDDRDGTLASSLRDVMAQALSAKNSKSAESAVINDT